MPIYEFYCQDCHTVFQFLSRSVGTERRPDCPRCGRKGLERRPSSFAVSKGRSEPEAAPPAGPDEDRLEKAMMALAEDPQALEAMDGEDPRAAARFMKRLYDTAGLPMTSALEEAIRRMEAGEDPEEVEADLGSALDEDPLLGEAGAEGPAKGPRRRFLPPRRDPELYEL